MEINAQHTLDAWKKSLKKILESGEKTGDAKTDTLEILNMTINIDNPADITGPIDALRSMKKWLYPELEELDDVIFRKEAASNYNYTYGARIFNFANAKNQVDDYLIPLFKQDPKTRRGIIVLYNPYLDSNATNTQAPGIISIYFKIQNKKLCATATIRSNDMLIGWPANIYQVRMLQEHLAEKLGIENGRLTTISHSAHIYENNIQEVNDVLSK